MNITTEPTKASPIGKLALAICLCGTVLAVGIALSKRFLGGDALTGAFILFVVFQVTALILGIIARREPLGRASAIAAGILLIAVALVVPTTRGPSRGSAPPSESVATPDTVKTK
ncbi:MAG: hypothetical protein EXS21_11450 [Pedosphaera sp.]|nr:hypothetical protein [Pedosphaera sp.]